MGMGEFLFTSESVTEGHPDKVADQVSDAILDALIAEDPKSRVACETLVTTGLALVAGEITTNARVDYPLVVRRTINNIGYTNTAYGFDGNSCAVIVTLDRQSPDIAMGVDEKESKEQGAGDQGLMFGYACTETEELMPMSIIFAHKLTKRLADVRRNQILNFVRPDGKSQVTVEYRNHKPARIDTVVISTQHSPEVSKKDLDEGIKEEVIKKVIPSTLMDKNTKFFINPTGRFVVGGPHGDCGLTGRKIIVDTYGGQGSHGGGAFSGKDPSKVDRSASYMGRYVAKNIIAAGLADKCELQIAYAIGVSEPVSIMINTFGTSKIPTKEIIKRVKANFSFKPANIIKKLDLIRPIYQKTAAYGHFGRNEKEFTWERTDMVDALK